MPVSAGEHDRSGGGEGRLERFLACGDADDDTPEERLAHRAMLTIGSAMAVGGVGWGLLSLLLGLHTAALIPIGYTLVTVANFAAFAQTRRFARARAVQLAISLGLPFLYQWAVGGFIASGAVMVWALLALLSSFAYADRRASRAVLAALLVLTALSGVIDDDVAARSPDLSTDASVLLLTLNVAAVSVVVYGFTRFYVEGIRRARRAHIEELVAALDAAEESNRLKSAFLTTMSHELRTPLNSIIGFAQVLPRHLGDRAEPHELDQLERIRTNGVHLLDLINDLLDLSRIEAGELEVVLDDVELTALADAVVADLAPLAEGRGLTLDLETATEPTTVSADTTRLRQVLTNLVANAIRFTDVGGVRVVVEEDRVRGRPRLLVVDTGIGIGPEHLDTIFEPFRQVEEGTARRHDGSGLGLAISRRLCEQMDIEMTVHSEPGQGSTFALGFPAR